jgi:hypothetical protein
MGRQAESAGAALKAQLATGLGLVAILAVAILLRSQHMTDVITRSPDERTYTANAARLTDEGFGVYRELFANYDRSPDQWIYPSPTRFGHVLLFAVVMRATGVRDGRAGAATSWLFSILSVALVAWIGLRFFHPCVALFAASLMACSFGELGMARRAWQDTSFGFCGLLITYLACEIARRPRARTLYVALFPALSIVGAFSLLTKETAVLSYGLVLLWLAGLATWESSWRRVAVVAAAGTASLAIALGVWIGLAGDARIALASVGHSVQSGAGAWAKQYCSGPWYQFPYLLWIAGPLTAAAALIGIAVTLSLGNNQVSRSAAIVDHRAAGLVAFVTLGFVSFASLYPNLQYLRIISPASGSYCLLGGLGVWFVLSRIRGYIARFSGPTFSLHAAGLAAGFAILIAAIHDYRSFTNIVVRSGMEELSVFGIRLLMHR